MRKKYIVGVDFGTTYSSIFEFNEQNKSPIGLTGSCSSYFYPTIISYSRGNWYFGEQALKKSQCILDVKRMFGILKDSPVLNNSKKLWETENITLRKSENGLIEIGLKNDPKDAKPDKWMSPDEIASKFIKYLFTDNDLRISRNKRIVVTCPADFNTIQRKVLMSAIELAGFSPEFVMLINEPSAAAISYFQDTNYENEYNNFLVCDFGGGTFDLTLLNIARKEFSIKSASGNRFLGGRDFDGAIFEWAKKKFENELKRKLNKAEIKQIKNQCQNAKIALNQNAKISIDILNDDDDEEYSQTLTREIFEKLAKPFLDQAIQLIDDFITKQVKLNKNSIEAILLVGGSSNLYLFKDRIKRYFNKDPLNYNMPREAIARGACYISAMLDSLIESPLEDMNFNQKLSHSIGTDYVTKPGGKRKFSEILPKDTKIPASGKRRYLSVKNNQKKVHIGVYECEELYLNNCVPIDEFSQRIKELPSGKAQIIVKMDIDTNGILTTTSKFKNLITNEYDSDYDDEVSRENICMSDCGNIHINENKKVLASSGVFYDRDELRQLVSSNRNPICVITGKPLTENLDDLECI